MPFNIGGSREGLKMTITHGAGNQTLVLGQFGNRAKSVSQESAIRINMWTQWGSFHTILSMSYI